MGVYDQLTQLDKHSPTPQENEPTHESSSIPSSQEEKQTIGSANSNPPKRKKPSMQESKIARKKSRKQGRLKESKKESFVSFIQPYLDLKASNTVSFRYPDDLLEKLEEAQYTIKKRYSLKVTKNSILVAALAHVIWDFEQFGKESFLYKQLIDRRR